SVSLLAMACASDALAACQGENTGNVLCDAAHQATGGQVQTAFNGDTVVNINAGAGIAGAYGLIVNGNGSITVDHNDPAGVRSATFEALRIYNSSDTGAVTYRGSADVIGNNGIAVSAGGGPVSITQTAGTITGVSVNVNAYLGNGSVDINTVGSRIGNGGVF